MYDRLGCIQCKLGRQNDQRCAKTQQKMSINSQNILIQMIPSMITQRKLPILCLP